MRFVSLLPAVMALFVSGAANAQAWAEYVNRDDFFTVNFPGDPTSQTVPYKTAKGTMLEAHVYKAQDRRGQYTITVIDYSKAPQAELATAIDEATAAIRTKGTVKYDAVNMLDMHRSWRMTVQTPAMRNILAEILVADNKHLYISEAETALNMPPAAQYQASLQILNDDGVRIRNREVRPIKEGEVVPVTPEAGARETARVTALVKGTWRNSNGGTCEAAYLKTAEATKTKRGEQSLAGTVNNSGMIVTGQLIVSGPREGQFINPMTDMVIFIFDPQGETMGLSALGPPATGWPDVMLSLCPGSRG